MAVDIVADLELLELHLVLSQGASFVREDKFDLTQFFYQVTVAAESKIHIIWVRKEHLDIVVNELGLNQLQHLYNDV